MGPKKEGKNLNSFVLFKSVHVVLICGQLVVTGHRWLC